MTKGRGDWATPDWLFDWVNDYARFDLDAAAQEHNAKCDQFCAPPDSGGPSGLLYDWGGHRVWCNPPYSNLGPWVEKGRSVGATDQDGCALLVPGIFSSPWFYRFAADYLVVLLTKRVSFVPPPDWAGHKAGAERPSALMLRGLTNAVVRRHGRIIIGDVRNLSVAEIVAGCPI